MRFLSALLQNSYSQWLGPAAALPRNLLEMQILGSHPDLLSQKPPGVGAQQVLTSSADDSDARSVRSTALKCGPQREVRAEGHSWLLSSGGSSLLYLKRKKLTLLVLLAGVVRKCLSPSLSIPKCFPSL